MLELTTRELLTQLFQHALDAVDGRRVVFNWCRSQLVNYRYCIAIGKAAPAMMHGALNAMTSMQKGLLICPFGSASRAQKKNKILTIVESSHPIPEQSSLVAGDKLLQFISQIPDDEPVLFLITGGASSLVEVLEDGISLKQLQDINQYLLSSGKNIQKINYWRKQVSLIKGGGLLEYVNRNQCTQLLISDVQNDDIETIASGLLVKPENTVVDNDDYLSSLLARIIHTDKKVETIETHIVASQKMALAAIKIDSEHYGVTCTVHEKFIDGDAKEQGIVIGNWLLKAPAGLHVWGGETTLSLPDKPGLGGRNQHFLLSCVESIQDKNISLLSAGTDGIDGNTSCAGGFVSGFTYKTLQQMGFDIPGELDNANAGNVLMAADCLYKPGRTNTNVMDIIIAYKSDENLVN